MNDIDIVTRLRNYDRCSDDDIDEAADEIARLRAEVAQRTAERDEARREITDRLKTIFTRPGFRHELERRGWTEWYKEVRK